MTVMANRPLQMMRVHMYPFHMPKSTLLQWLFLKHNKEAVSVSERYYRDTLVHVDLEAIHHNYKMIASKHPDKTFIEVVMPDGYGLGSDTLAHYLADRGIGYFAVTTLYEANDLMLYGFQ